jgi:hypothetical protein
MDRPTALDWSPRVLLLAFAAFLAIFALDVFGEGLGFWKTLLALVMHLLPNLALVLLVALAWRRPWIGALVCLALAALYASTFGRRFPWTATAIISGPLVLTGALYVASWARRLRPRTS